MTSYKAKYLARNAAKKALGHNFFHVTKNAEGRWEWEESFFKKLTPAERAMSDEEYEAHLDAQMEEYWALRANNK